ncbi:MAG TPA: hypothetical protein K8W06_04575 [Limosilactobacillus coleohominis]|nr:hypothetical protein [Limosilactobacillus coleohominis]
MYRDIKSLGYGIITSIEKLPNKGEKQIVAAHIAVEKFVTGNKGRLFASLDYAKEKAKQNNGKVVELYAREVEDSEDE